MKLSALMEGYFTSFKTKDRMGTPVNCEIFKDPTRKELNYAHSTYAVQGDEVAGYIDPSGHLYIWTPYLLHHTVFESGRIPQNSVSVRLHYDASDCHVIVTDSTKRTTWHHNPEIVDLINNSYVNKLFNVVEISYYDEDIVGDWNELNESPVSDFIEKKTEEEGDLYVKDAVSRFVELKNQHKLRGPEKDINHWTNRPFKDFLQYLQFYHNTNSKRAAKKNVKSKAIKAADNSKYSIVIPLDRKSCQRYGAGTQWCISGMSYNEFNNYFYDSDNTIFIINDKVHRNYLDQPEKFAIIYHYGGMEVYDSSDSAVEEDDFYELFGLSWNDFHHYYDKYEKEIEAGRAEGYEED